MSSESMGIEEGLAIFDRELSLKEDLARILQLRIDVATLCSKAHQQQRQRFIDLRHIRALDERRGIEVIWEENPSLVLEIMQKPRDLTDEEEEIIELEYELRCKMNNMGYQFGRHFESSSLPREAQPSASGEENIFDNRTIVKNCISDQVGRYHNIVPLTSDWKQKSKKIPNFTRKTVDVISNGRKHLTRPDSGSEMNHITEDFAKTQRLFIQNNGHDKTTLQLGDGRYVESIGRVYLPLRIVGYGFSEESRWFNVLKKCPFPMILGKKLISEIGLYTTCKHLLVDGPSSWLKIPLLNWIGSASGSEGIAFRADGVSLVGAPDTGADLDYMSLECALRCGYEIDTSINARRRTMVGDEEVLETAGQVHISTLELGVFEPFEMTFHVLPGLPRDVVFGEQFLEETDAFNNLLDMEGPENLEENTFITIIDLGPIIILLQSITTRTKQKIVHQRTDIFIFQADRHRLAESRRLVADEDQPLSSWSIQRVKDRCFYHGRRFYIPGGENSKGR